jgi:dTDP-4-amino-4,6-dideoxygalactose transaminase
MTRPVFITSSPNAQADDVNLARSLWLKWWTRNRSEYLTDFAQNLHNYLRLGNDNRVYLLDSGRSALYFLLSALEIGIGDEVIMPAFTCLAVANPVQWSGATPIYVDAEINSFNMNLDLLASKITAKTKVIIAQHTFGRPVDMQRLQMIVGERKILIIEDCAHSLGGVQQGKKLGNIGDAAILGFGIDKAISGVRGGGVVIDFNRLQAKGYDIDAEKLTKIYAKLPEFPQDLTWKSVLNPLIWSIVTPLYFIGFRSFTIGRLLIRVLFKLGIIGNVVNEAENVGGKPSWMPAKMAPALARLADNQLAKLDRMNTHRRLIAQIYCELLEIPLDSTNQVYQKFSFLLRDHAQRKPLYELAKNKLWIVIGDWLPRPLYAKFSSTEVYQALSYNPAENPLAEMIGQRIVNLPTSVNINVATAAVLGKLVNEFLRKY